MIDNKLATLKKLVFHIPEINNSHHTTNFKSSASLKQ